MLRFFESASYPIGIDVGSHALRMLQFKKGDGALALQAASRVELDSVASTNDDRLVAAIRHALAGGNFAGKRVVLSLPIAAVHAKSIRLPPMPDSDLTQALQWEAKDRFGFEVGESRGQLVWFRAGEVRRGTEIKDELLLFAVQAEALNTHIQAITEAGLQLVGIDIAPCAAYPRAVRRAAPAFGTGVAALLDVGQQGAQFLITRDGELVFYKHIDIGGKTIHEAIAAKLGISPLEACQMRARMSLDSDSEEAAPLRQALRDAMRSPLEELAREVDMCMRYFVVTFRGARPETIELIGRQAGCAHVRESLTAALGLQVEEAPVLRSVQDLGDAARPDRSGEWAIAAGLSLYPLHGAQQAEAAA